MGDRGMQAGQVTLMFTYDITGGEVRFGGKHTCNVLILFSYPYTMYSYLKKVSIKLGDALDWGKVQHFLAKVQSIYMGQLEESFKNVTEGEVG